MVMENMTMNRFKGVRIEGLDGSFVIVVGFYWLTDELVIIEVRRREKKKKKRRKWGTVLERCVEALAHYPVSR